MNIKFQVGEICPLIDKQIPVNKLVGILQPLAKQANLIFVEQQVGAGYLQWSLSGSDWVAFTKGTEQQKSDVAEVYKMRRIQMQNAMQGSPLKDVVFSVPSEDFIFFRPNGENWEIALVAWGYKYPDKPVCKELDTWITKTEKQIVNIAFSWAGQTLPEFNFIFSGNKRTTSSDGFFHVDQPLSVGNLYSVETLVGHRFTLFVEKGKADYIFDLTQHFQAEVVALQDNVPLPNCFCELSFNGNVERLVTDASGRANIKLPLLSDLLGQLSDPQPPCIATCNKETQQKVPFKDGDVLSFVFSFATETPPVPEDKEVQVKVEVFRGDKPVEGQASEILFAGNLHIVNADSKGEAFFKLVLKADEQGQVSTPQSVCEVICEQMRQTKTIVSDTDHLVFRFNLPEEPTKEPEYVYVQLKDYSGEPLVDMPFNLTTKEKGCVKLQTDGEGMCQIPKDWFTPKEKMKIDFVVSSEYQQTHDIHYNKNKKQK